MDDRLKNVDENAITDGSCGGFRHCIDKVCDPTDEECKECIEDYDNAIKEIYNGN